MTLGLVFAAVGLCVLSIAADQFVKGAARMAVVLKVAPVVVGAVVVGFGTSAPEMVVSGLAAADGQLDIGVGNIVGSNVANMSLVLGAAALFGTVFVAPNIIRRDGISSVAAVIVFATLLQTGLNRWAGGLLVVVLLIWLWLVLRSARVDTVPVSDASVTELVGDKQPSLWIEATRTLLGLAFVVVSAYLLVDGAERVADALGLSGGLVGYTLVAVGTSAPELVTAIVAVRQRETELLVGNLLGSNVFNSLAVGGVIGLVGTGASLDVNLQVLGALLMVLICVVSWCVMAIGQQVNRVKGVSLLVLWAISIVLLAGVGGING